MDTAGRIKILRLLNGYTQEAIAALIGISRPSIVVWESGKHPPSPEFVIRLAGIGRGRTWIYLIWQPACFMQRLDSGAAGQSPEHITLPARHCLVVSSASR